jgi:RNA polymerase subunit RPABC4/transcription elongation factor Spt4
MTKKCKSCQSEIDAKAKKCPHCHADLRSWFGRHPVWTVILVLIVIGSISSAAESGSKTSSTNSSSSTSGGSQNSAQSGQPTSIPATRQVKGKTTTLGAGTFAGGKDVPVGLYDVTAGDQSGNFIVSGTDTYDEIFGQGVTKVRAQISDGDKVELSGLSNVIFTPVLTPFVTTHMPVTLYAGTFTVGQDIGAGSYVATTKAGSTGNFIVSGSNSVDEILGQNGAGGVPSVTTDLSDGDVITISGLGSVTMTPK